MKLKKAELIALALAGVAVYMIVQASKKKATAPAPGAQKKDLVTEIFDASRKAFSNGWRYFSDGTVIDPSGNYYKGGQMIWSNPTPTTIAADDLGNWL